MPGRSLTRPPRTSTTECSWRLCPSRGMYLVTSIPFVRRTRATLRSAEFGFFGVCVNTRVQTPRRCGAPASAGVFVFAFCAVRPFLTSWLTVGIAPLSVFPHNNGRRALGLANRGGHGSERPRARQTAKTAWPSHPRPLQPCPPVHAFTTCKPYLGRKSLTLVGTAGQLPSAATGKPGSSRGGGGKNQIVAAANP